MSIRIPYDTMKETVRRALENAGLDAESAAGVESHGLNRIPRFVDYIPVEEIACVCR